MICPSCGVELPHDARFCIECGVALPERASTGATVALPRLAPSAVPCPACGAAGPEGADYCVRCGRRLADPLPAPAPAPAPMQPASHPRMRRPRPALHLPPATRQRRHGRVGDGVGSALFLIGLGLLFLLKLPFWPAILVVWGLAHFVNYALRGRVLDGFAHTLWLFGLAFLFTVPRLWFPGMIILVGLSMLLHLGQRYARRP
jgi:Double zinc ribbon